MITTSNLIFGCFLTFSFHASLKKLPYITYSRAVMAPTFPPYPLQILGMFLANQVQGGGGHLAKTNICFGMVTQF